MDPFSTDYPFSCHLPTPEFQNSSRHWGSSWDAQLGNNPFPYAAFSSYVPSDSLLCFHVFPLFLFTFGSAFIFISLTFSSSFARFAWLPTLVSAHIHVRPCNLEELILPSSLQKAFAWQDIAVQENVSSHSFTVLSHTLFFSKDWKKLKSCPRTAVPQF